MSTISVINVKHPSSASNNLVTDSSGNTTAAGTVAMGSSFLRNRIINGAMVIDQRNAGASVTVTAGGVFGTDRWQAVEDTDGTITMQQSSVSPAGFANSLLFTTGTADASLGATQYVILSQIIEGFNVADLGWGTANAQTITISFWVRSSLTGTFGGALRNSAANRSYAFSFTINSANTFEYKTVTIAGDTSGTWLTDNTVGIRLNFGLGAGSTYSGSAGSWQAANLISPTGAQSVIGTAGATFYITGVQLEVGTVATPFERRLYGTELALCQRYYYRMKAATNYANFGMGRAYNTTGAGVNIELPVPMRAAPSGSTSGYGNFNSSGTSTTVTNLDPVNQYDTNYRRMSINVVSTFTSGQAVALNAENTTAAEMSWSAEL